MVLKVPAQRQHVVAPIEKLIETVSARTEQMRRDGGRVDYAAIERLLAEQVAAIESRGAEPGVVWRWEPRWHGAGAEDSAGRL